MRHTTEPSQADRRTNLDLREVLDELITHVRLVSRTGEEMGSRQREYARERLEWLAEEVWRLATQTESAE